MQFLLPKSLHKTNLKFTDSKTGSFIIITSEYWQPGAFLIDVIFTGLGGGAAKSNNGKNSGS